MFKIAEKTTEKRLAAWKNLRQHLETSSTPLEDVANFFNQHKIIKFYTDPYDQSTWPTAWELIEENQYCRFNLLLGICYTLQLCNRFNKSKPKITISIDKLSNSVYYLLFIEDLVYGYVDEEWTSVNNIPKSLKNIKIYEMPFLY